MLDSRESTPSPEMPQQSNRLTMKTWILRFLSDESGAESIELAISGAVVAAGSVAGYLAIKGQVEEKQIDLVRKLHNASSN